MDWIVTEYVVYDADVGIKRIAMVLLPPLIWNVYSIHYIISDSQSISSPSKVYNILFIIIILKRKKLNGLWLCSGIAITSIFLIPFVLSHFHRSHFHLWSQFFTKENSGEKMLCIWTISTETNIYTENDKPNKIVYNIWRRTMKRKKRNNVTHP